jgi:hypothetical protein
VRSRPSRCRVKQRARVSSGGRLRDTHKYSPFLHLDVIDIDVMQSPESLALIPGLWNLTALLAVAFTFHSSSTVHPIPLDANDSGYMIDSEDPGSTLSWLLHFLNFLNS